MMILFVFLLLSQDDSCDNGHVHDQGHVEFPHNVRGNLSTYIIGQKSECFQVQEFTHNVIQIHNNVMWD